MGTTEERILDAALEAASLHGLGRMSVADVAKRAGLSRPSV
jgi:AcrR family transcriptional regulator